MSSGRMPQRPVDPPQEPSDPLAYDQARQPFI